MAGKKRINVRGKSGAFFFSAAITEGRDIDFRPDIVYNNNTKKRLFPPMPGMFVPRRWEPAGKDGPAMSDKPESNMEEMGLEADLITLEDEDGQEYTFELVDRAEYEGQEYVALIPIYETADELLEDSGELVVMKVSEENGDFFVDAIEDEELYNHVGDFFTERLSDIFDFEED